MRKFTLLVVAFICPLLLNAQTYQLVWSDEFTNGVSSSWAQETGGGGWGNNELQYYQAANTSVSGGILKITAKRENVGGMSYTSSRLKTQGLKSFKYGRMEARMQLPSFQGAWPAFWMLGENISSVGWPACGEIDIMETVNTEQKVYGTIHWDSNGHASYGGNTATATTAYHVYSIEWDANAIKWFVDGVQYHVVNIQNSINSTEEFHRNFFFILNLAVGGQWPGYTVNNAAFPATMNVDYVRVYQLTSTPTPTCNTVTVPGKIEAESYCQMSGVQNETCSEGGQDVGWVDNGDWMNYQINVPSTGTYTVSYRVASPNATGQLRLDKDAGATVLGTVNIPNTGGWQNWTTVSHNVTLPAGTYYIGTNALTGGFNINYIDIKSAAQSFYQKIEAESYATMVGVQTETCSEGGQDVGWIDATDYMTYNVNLPYTGTYTLKYRIASPSATGVLILSKNAADVNVVGVPNTGGWQNWSTISQNVTLSAGSQTLALYARTGGFNVNWWSLEYGANGTKSAKVDEVSTEISQDDILVYPNPATNFLKVELTKNYQDASLTLFDLNGRVVENIKLSGENSANFDLSTVKSGIYMLRVNDGSNNKMIKIFKK